MSFKLLLAFAALLMGAALLGCSSAPTTRTLTGQIKMSDFVLDNPVVIAQSSTGRAFVTAITSGGRFSLVVPAGQSYRLTLANSTASGAFLAVSRVRWPISGTPRWAFLGAGGTVALDNVHAVSSAGLTSADDSAGSSGGSSSGSSSGSDDSSSDSSSSDDGIRQCHSGDGGTDDGAKDGCEDDHTALCADDGADDSECDSSSHDGMSDDSDGQAHEHEHEAGDQAACTASGNPPPTASTPGTGGPSGAPCVLNRDCAGGLACFSSACAPPVL